jgi:hypothetical protein
MIIRRIALMASCTAAAALAAAASAQIVVNGDFETGTLPPWQFIPDPNGEPTMVPTVDTFQNSFMFRVNPGHDGSGGAAGGNLQQEVILQLGAQYVVSGDLYIENLRTGNNSNGGTITITLGGQPIHEFFVGTIPALSTISDTFSVPFVAQVAGSHTLQLRFTRTFRNSVPSIYHWVDNLAISGGTPPCYADCDGNEALTVDDFICFINEFASAQSLPPAQQIGHYANCDGSTTEPVLTVDDFICFINDFAAGCP